MSQQQDKSRQEPVVKKAVEPKKLIEPGVLLAINLDDISRKLSELLISIASIEKLDKAILQELIDEADAGEYIFRDGTASTILSANIIDVIGILGFPVKGYTIKNDGTNTIEVGHNITPSSIDSNVPTGAARFYPVFATETYNSMYNRKKINNIYIRTQSGTSDYRLWLLW